jgi:hypothetical protein
VETNVSQSAGCWVCLLLQYLLHCVRQLIELFRFGIFKIRFIPKEPTITPHSSCYIRLSRDDASPVGSAERPRELRRCGAIYLACIGSLSLSLSRARAHALSLCVCVQCVFLSSQTCSSVASSPEFLPAVRTRKRVRAHFSASIGRCTDAHGCTSLCITPQQPKP